MKLPITLEYNQAASLVYDMLDSNPYIGVNTSIGYFETAYGFDEEIDRIPPTDITIKSITINKPTFSVGDTVMILDTLEIGEIIEQDDEEAYITFNENSGCWNNHRGLVKIPPHLVSILQNNDGPTT